MKEGATSRNTAFLQGWADSGDVDADADMSWSDHAVSHVRLSKASETEPVTEFTATATVIVQAPFPCLLPLWVCMRGCGRGGWCCWLLLVVVVVAAAAAAAAAVAAAVALAVAVAAAAAAACCWSCSTARASRCEPSPVVVVVEFFRGSCREQAHQTSNTTTHTNTNKTSKRQASFKGSNRATEQAQIKTT